jgi:capsular polysaccharide biosynthesis protein
MNRRWQMAFAMAIVFLLKIEVSYTQTFNVNLSSKHLTKINESKSAHQRLKKYKKYYSRDSARQLKKLNAFYKRKYDSTNRTLLKEQKFTRLLEKKGFKVIIPGSLTH